MAYKLKRIFFLALFLLSVVSCATKTQPFTTNNENVWFLEAGQVSTFPIYCMANRTENTAAPVCYEAKKK